MTFAQARKLIAAENFANAFGNIDALAADAMNEDLSDDEFEIAALDLRSTIANTTGYASI